MSTCLVVLQAGLNAFECFFFNLFLSLAVAESVMHVIRAVLLHYTIVVADCPRLFDKLMLFRERDVGDDEIKKNRRVCC
ncbi:hypothetical protein PF005_g33154 [Phytophthora fragariae]|uniref:Uncharacterized protein n=1 Tax=Phytophthora fragariae TaxID=53985 RepID=A0A6A3V0M9_9STRA|nr:hypothetical protein PF005_g33154 [Phytophthora fragariae]